ncbi:MAG: glutamate formimidoyltransferase [Deltaproteobacteria bacterium]|nr:glutamate formimidoyltransferase [Deltaproteobacteria bacterium]MBN2674696.1 glutamate formimidoyltransferase [Deltaproteobacteria bacterium]
MTPKENYNLVECVPNVSEGRNPATIQKLTAAISQVPEVSLLHVDSNQDANRTVFTFVGSIADVIRAALELVKTAGDLIDMRSQSGEHVRNGAVDVCPLIPIRNITTAECVAAARELGRRIGLLGIPVYLYGDAATHESRFSLASLRKGQYEALRQKLSQPKWTPDFGPAHWNEIVARTGSVQVGVRPFLVAFNVNLDTSDVSIAKHIARQIRTSGFRGVPGEFSHLKADGWWMEHYRCVQVTMNFTDIRLTPVHVVLNRIRQLATALGTTATSSELIGLIPEQTLLEAAAASASEPPATHATDALLQQGAAVLGLTAVEPFHLDERVLERKLSFT